MYSANKPRREHLVECCHNILLCQRSRADWQFLCWEKEPFAFNGKRTFFFMLLLLLDPLIEFDLLVKDWLAGGLAQQIRAFPEGRHSGHGKFFGQSNMLWLESLASKIGFGPIHVDNYVGQVLKSDVVGHRDRDREPLRHAPGSQLESTSY
ncbi:hypothetical protein DAT35_02365 [Vitiosangium sp. GDMCC 1.1324]|nr:hypothetical protein DAT35_02365 [Vitiosangium sp. GDMCC 1.1324]